MYQATGQRYCHRKFTGLRKLPGDLRPPDTTAYFYFSPAFLVQFMNGFNLLLAGTVPRHRPVSTGAFDRNSAIPGSFGETHVVNHLPIMATFLPVKVLPRWKKQARTVTAMNFDLTLCAELCIMR
jgi:hypothetical protein